jgi:hypothetical protein
MLGRTLLALQQEGAAIVAAAQRKFRKMAFFAFLSSYHCAE